MNKKIIDCYKNFSKNIKFERKAKGLTQKQVSELLGIKTQSYQAYEAGISMPTVENLIKLAAIYEASIDELFEI